MGGVKRQQASYFFFIGDNLFVELSTAPRCVTSSRAHSSVAIGLRTSMRPCLHATKTVRLVLCKGFGAKSEPISRDVLSTFGVDLHPYSFDESHPMLIQRQEAMLPLIKYEKSCFSKFGRVLL